MAITMTNDLLHCATVPDQPCALSGTAANNGCRWVVCALSGQKQLYSEKLTITVPTSQ